VNADMIIEHFIGKKECNNIEELEAILAIRTAKGVNEFSISGDNYYPYLVITVKEHYAVVNYLKEEGSAYIAIGGNSEFGSDGCTVFNSCSETEEMEMDNYYVLDFSDAKIVAKDFFNNMELSENVKWSEL